MIAFIVFRFLTPLILFNLQRRFLMFLSGFHTIKRIGTRETDPAIAPVIGTFAATSFPF